MFADVSAPGRLAPSGLSAASELWLASLPRRVRPLALSERYPRLVNQLALCWKDHGLTDRVLSSLIVDRRGGRQGFPPAVLDELMNLREFHGDRQAEQPEAMWAESTLATVDR